jgi:hypothetical protein
MTPGPSLAGVRLVIADHVVGLPVLRALPLCACCRHYPGAAVGCLVCSLPQPCQPSPIWLSGRPTRRPFRGLLGVHSRYGLHTHAATNSWHASPKASTVSLPPQLLRLLPAGAIAGWDFHPLGSAAFPRRTPSADTPLIRVLLMPLGHVLSERGCPHYCPSAPSSRRKLL